MHEVDKSPNMTAPTLASYRPATANAAGSSASSTAPTSASAAPAAAASAPKAGTAKSEGHHLWAHESFSFSDVLDAINPLQHLPIISMIYRSITGDNIGNVARVIGDGLYGGAIGAAFGMVDAVMVEETGKDIGGNLVAMVTGDDKEGKAASGTGRAVQDPAPVVTPNGDAGDTMAANAPANGHSDGRGIARADAPAPSGLSGHVAHAHAELTPGSAAASPQSIDDLYKKALAARNANSNGPAVADPNKPVDLPFFPGTNGGTRPGASAPGSRSSSEPANNTSANNASAATSTGIPIDIAAAQSGLHAAGAMKPAAAGGHGMNALPGTNAGHGYAIDTSPNGILAMRASHTAQAVPLQMPAGSGLSAAAAPMPPASMDDFAQRMKQGMDKYSALMAQKKLAASADGAGTAGSQINQSY